MSFVTWLALPVVITVIASLIMLLVSRWPRSDMHHDIENFARFRGALARHTTAAEVAGRRRRGDPDDDPDDDREPAETGRR